MRLFVWVWVWVWVCAGLRALVIVSMQGPSGEQAKRVQIPLELGWNFSVHRSQGMSLDRVEMSLRNVFEYGQVCQRMCARFMCV